MKVFNVDNNITIVCEWKKTRNGFKHEATIFHKGFEMGFAKVNYINRTWESYEYETVMKKALQSSRLSEDDKKKVKSFLVKV